MAAMELGVEISHPWVLFGAFLLLFLPLYLYFALPVDLPLPGPRPLPFPFSAIRHFREVKRYGGTHLLQYDYSKKYGKVYKMHSVGKIPTICVLDTDMIKQIMVKDFLKFRDRGLPIKLPPPIDSEMFVANYDKWKRVRKVIAPTFTASRLKGIADVIDEVTARLKSKLKRFSDTGETVEITDLFSLCILDVILSSAFGVDTADLQTSKDRTLLERAKTIFNRPFAIVMIGIFPLANFISKYVNVVGNAGFFMNLGWSIIQQRQKQGFSGRCDAVQLMLDANKTIVDGESKLNEDEMRAACLSFLAAGYETTSGTLICASYFLATNEHVQEKLAREIEKAREACEEGASLYEFIHQVGFLDWVLKEVLRMCPPGHRHMRQCNEDCIIKGVYFKKGVHVHIPAYSIHHDPEVWPDPFTFDPERFSPQEEAKRHPFTYLPFGCGPRQCVGMRFANMVMKIVLVRVMEAGYRFRLSSNSTPLVLKSFTQLKPQEPVYLKIEKHSKA